MAVQLSGDRDRAFGVVHVLPGQPQNLGYPHPRLGCQLEKKPMLYGHRLDEPRKLVARKDALRLLILDARALTAFQ